MIYFQESSRSHSPPLALRIHDGLWLAAARWCITLPGCNTAAIRWRQVVENADDETLPLWLQSLRASDSWTALTYTVVVCPALSALLMTVLAYLQSHAKWASLKFAAAQIVGEIYSFRMLVNRSLSSYYETLQPLYELKYIIYLKFAL